MWRCMYAAASIFRPSAVSRFQTSRRDCAAGGAVDAAGVNAVFNKGSDPDGIPSKRRLEFPSSFERCGLVDAGSGRRPRRPFTAERTRLELHSEVLFSLSLPAWYAHEGIVHIVFTARRGLLPAVRLFIDELVAHCADRLGRTSARSPRT
jgi:hypothetical protein